MADRHDWNGWDSYFSTHVTRITAFEHFIARDEVVPVTTAQQVRWKGGLYCDGGIEIHVHRLQDVRYRDGRPEVRTQEYSYHVLQRRSGSVRNIFRYDNIGEHGGNDRHHCHRFDESVQRESVENVGVEGWPALSDVITEAFEWWSAQTRG